MEDFEDFIEPNSFYTSGLIDSYNDKCNDSIVISLVGFESSNDKLFLNMIINSMTRHNNHYFDPNTKSENNIEYVCITINDEKYKFLYSYINYSDKNRYNFKYIINNSNMVIYNNHGWKKESTIHILEDSIDSVNKLKPEKIIRFSNTLFYDKKLELENQLSTFNKLGIKLFNNIDIIYTDFDDTAIYCVDKAFYNIVLDIKKNNCMNAINTIIKSSKNNFNSSKIYETEKVDYIDEYFKDYETLKMVNNGSKEYEAYISNKIYGLQFKKKVFFKTNKNISEEDKKKILCKQQEIEKKLRNNLEECYTIRKNIELKETDKKNKEKIEKFYDETDFYIKNYSDFCKDMMDNINLEKSEGSFDNFVDKLDINIESEVPTLKNNKDNVEYNAKKINELKNYKENSEKQIKKNMKIDKNLKEFFNKRYNRFIKNIGELNYFPEFAYLCGIKLVGIKDVYGNKQVTWFEIDRFKNILLKTNIKISIFDKYTILNKNGIIQDIVDEKINVSPNQRYLNKEYSSEIIKIISQNFILTCNCLKI